MNFLKIKRKNTRKKKLMMKCLKNFLQLRNQEKMNFQKKNLKNQ